MVSMEEEPASVMPVAGAAAGAAAAANAEARRPGRRRWRWCVAGAMMVGAMALVVAGAATGFRARGGGGDDEGARAGATLRPLSEPVLSDDGSSGSIGSSVEWPPPPSSSLSSSKQQPQARAPTKAPSLAPPASSSSSSNSTNTAGKAPPATMLELLVALQQEGDKKYITSDYFGNEIPKENNPGHFAHLTGETDGMGMYMGVGLAGETDGRMPVGVASETDGCMAVGLAGKAAAFGLVQLFSTQRINTGAPTATVIDDGAPVCHVENSIELRQAIEVRLLIVGLGMHVRMHPRINRWIDR